MISLTAVYNGTAPFLEKIILVLGLNREDSLGLLQYQNPGAQRAEKPLGNE